MDKQTKKSFVVTGEDCNSSVSVSGTDHLGQARGASMKLSLLSLHFFRGRGKESFREALAFTLMVKFAFHVEVLEGAGRPGK